MPKSTDLHYSLEIFSDQISRAYGRAYIHTLSRNTGIRQSASQNIGSGAVVISRRIPYGALDENKAILGRPEHTTSIRVDPQLDAARLKSMAAADYSAEPQRRLTLQLEGFVNDNFIYATDDKNVNGISLLHVEALTTVNSRLTDNFTVKVKNQDRAIKFIGESTHSSRGVVIQNTDVAYILSFSQDSRSENVFLFRLAPVIAADKKKTASGKYVYESLFIFNTLKLCTGFVIPYPALLPELSNENTDVVQEIIRATKDIQQSKTIEYLRSEFPIKMYFPRGSGGNRQNEESVAYINVFLQNLARLHYTYNALTAIAAAMDRESLLRDQQREWSGGAGSSRSSGGSRSATDASMDSSASSRNAKNSLTKTALDDYILAFRASIRKALLTSGAGLPTGKFANGTSSNASQDVEYQKDMESIYMFIAAAAHWISKKYMVLQPEGDSNATNQEYILSLVDDGSMQDAPTRRASYGHYLTKSILKSLPVKTVSMEHTTKRVGSSPIDLTLHEVVPFTYKTEYGDALTLKIYYTAYHRQFLNLARFVSTDGMQWPTWMKHYTTVNILAPFNPLKIGDSPAFGRVIPTRLNLDQKIEVTVHTFIRGIDGARVKNDKKRKPAV